MGPQRPDTRTLARLSVSILEEGGRLGLKCLLLSYFRVGDISGWATILPEPSKKLPTSRLNECLALLPRTGNYWFSRIRSVADSLINSDFADFTVLQVYTGSRSAFRHSRTAGPPSRKNRRPRFPKNRFQARRLTRALKDRHDTGLSVENMKDRTCEFRIMIRGSSRGETN